MSSLNELIESLIKIADDPIHQINEAKNNGEKIIGCVPYFAPVELVHAAGMRPIEIWGGGTQTSAAGSYYPAFYCSVLFTLMENALDGKYDNLSGVIIPTTCDGLRNLEENWKFALPDSIVMDFVQPAARDTRESRDYMVGQLKYLAKNLEKISGKKITERAIRNSINLYNRQRKIMRDFSEISADHADVITPKIRKAIFAAARTMPVEQHIDMVSRINNELNKRPPYIFSGIKIILTGILVDSDFILNEFSKNDIAIVGDLTISESIRFNTDVPGRIDPFISLAEYWKNIEGASVALDPSKKRGLLLRNLVEQRKADGIIACVVKFCEEEEFDIPVLTKIFAKQKIPFLVLEVESQDSPNEQISTRIEAFAEMLKSTR